MIHFRRTVHISPGRQADAVARVHEWLKIHRTSTGIEGRVSVVTTGSLGRLCISVGFERMGAKEAADAKANAYPDWKALGAKQDREQRDGTAPFVPGTTHDEFWRDA